MKNNQRIMCKSDMLFARLMLSGRVVAEGMLTGISDTSELLAKVRAAAKGHTGLAMLYVRSFSRRWQMERPLRLYPERPSSRLCLVYRGPRFHWEI